MAGRARWRNAPRSRWPWSGGDLVSAGHEIVITHGNGPQVGNLLVKNEVAASTVPPLDWCGAQTQATLGMLIMNALDRVLSERGVHRPVAALVTRTLVDADDPGFGETVKQQVPRLTNHQILAMTCHQMGGEAGAIAPSRMMTWHWTTG